MKIKVPEDFKSSCIFSPCLKYRYLLKREFKKSAKKFLVFVMLNPSTADEKSNDPTVLRCQNHALNRGFDGFIVLNIFAFRSTDPKKMIEQKDPIGKDNDKHILKVLKKHKDIICAWGNHGKVLNRSEDFKTFLKENNIKNTKAFDITKTEEPKHPLYISYQKELVDFL